MTANN